MIKERPGGGGGGGGAGLGKHGGGGSRCRMSIIRKGNVAPSNLLFKEHSCRPIEQSCRPSLRNNHVACRKGLKRTVSPCLF